MMKSLADLKRKLKGIIDDPVKTVTVVSRKPDGSERYRVENAPVDRVQTKDFCIRRPDGRRGWMAFDKAADWTYEAAVATHRCKNGYVTTVTFNS